MSLVQQFANLFQRRPVDNVPGSTPDGAAPGAPSLADDSLLPGQALAPSELPSVALPLLGNAPAVVQQRRMLAVLGLGLVLLASGSVWMLVQSDRSAQQLAVNGQALMHSQRLTHWTSQAVNGDARAFDRVKDSARTLVRSVRGLARGDNRLGVAAVDTSNGKVLKEITSLMQRADKAAKVVLAQQEALTQTADALRTVNRQSVELLELAEALSTLSLQKGATPAQMATVGQLSVLTQRIGKSVNELQTAEGSVSEVVSLLGKDLELFKQMSLSLLEGNAELRLPATRDAPTRAQLQAVIALYEQARTGVTVVQDNVDGLVAAREARKTIHGDSEPLRRQLETLQEVLRAQSALGAGPLVLLGLAGLCLLLGGMGIVRVQQLDSRQRQMLAEQLQQHGPRHDQEAQRANDVNQAAIVRLMDELQAVAEGDLTQQASVTEDITGALADSVNHTVQELRVLVGSVQNTALRVAQTSTQVDSTSTGLLAAATEQLGEIRETGRAVFEMAQRINQVSAQAQESATVASQSLQAADQGLKAVLNTIGGMNSIRDQIQDTAKRIKRLGESSQEIGEITELISDITEQTNVLALNAAIQAASAGEAGRGFSVVAEEVQRLAERSADATRQIALLVKAIQTDTQDAVAAMERSTQGVVQGAQLSDTAGTALGEIDSVARRLAELIAQIAQSTSSEAELANGLANNIQQIFVVTEQTVDGTRSTAQQVRELAQLAEELRQSVARFKIA